MQSSPIPELLSISQCNNNLQFDVISHWPLGLPAVAINRHVIGGFSQNLVFNHSIPVEEAQKIRDLILSIYPRLSFVEAASFWIKSQTQTWVPFEMVLEKWGFRLNDNWQATALRVTSLPAPIRRWLAEKSVGPQELQILASAGNLSLDFLWLRILKMSRQQGVQALELGLELLLLKHPVDEIEALPGESADDWISRLRLLRYPETALSDQRASHKTKDIPWPGQSQVRWVRSGDRAGLELKIFVSNPSDLKKSFQKIQDLLDENSDSLWPEQ